MRTMMLLGLGDLTDERHKVDTFIITIVFRAQSLIIPSH